MNGTAPARVSVIVPTRNRSALLREALASVRAVEGPDLALEIVVANDGSDDDTARVVAEFGAIIIDVSPPGSPAGRGTPAARNAGLRAASGEFFTFLDDDDLWLPEHIRPHLARFRADPELSVVVGQVVNTDEDRTPISDPWPPDFPPDWDAVRVLFRWVVQIGAFVSRMSVRESVGPFDEEDPEAYDWDWYFRIALAHRVGFLHVPCVLFRQRSVQAFRDDIDARRNAYNSSLFLRYVRQAGGRRPPLAWLARTYLEHRGLYYWLFTNVASARADASDEVGARRALLSALRISPMHAINDLRRPSPFRSTLQTLATRRLPRSKHRRA